MTHGFSFAVPPTGAQWLSAEFGLAYVMDPRRLAKYVRAFERIFLGWFQNMFRISSLCLFKHQLPFQVPSSFASVSALLGRNIFLIELNNSHFPRHVRCSVAFASPKLCNHLFAVGAIQELWGEGLNFRDSEG